MDCLTGNCLINKCLILPKRKKVFNGGWSFAFLFMKFTKFKYVSQVALVNSV